MAAQHLFDMTPWQSEATRRLLAAYDKVEGSGSAPVRISPTLSDWESKSLIQGLDQGLFEIDVEGYVQSSMLPQSPTRADKQRMIQLFWHHRDRPRTLFREGVCQLATVARLILDRGVKRSQLRMEPSIAEFGDLAYAIDILIVSESGGLVVGCEVKKDNREHNKLLVGFEHCCTRGPHSKNECQHATNHAKYAICVKHRPKYFVASSPQLETIYKLAYSDGQVLREPIPSFDPISMYINPMSA